MLEIEVKYPDADFGDLERRLAAWGAAEGEPCDQADLYFNAPDRDFARTDEALRLRRVGEANRVTYKGPKRDARTKTRAEIEVGLDSGAAAAADFARLLTHLGYRPVTVVRKRRRTFHLERDGFPIEVALDEVEGLGRFAELEIQAPEECLAAARAALLTAAGELGLKDQERRAYLQLLLEKEEGKS